VTVVTPSYNQGPFIEETLLSVKHQDYANIEHLVIDGGSTDETLGILRRYEATYPLRWISEPDRGQADALNKGFRRAQGEMIGWLNSDFYGAAGVLTPEILARREAACHKPLSSNESHEKRVFVFLFCHYHIQSSGSTCPMS
jgi:glycosyltransferase involved in cell wall biosynthesis